MAPWDLQQTLTDPSDAVQGVGFLTIDGVEHLVLVENSGGTGYVYQYNDAAGEWAVTDTFTTSQTVWGMGQDPTGEYISLASANNNLIEIRETSGWTVETTLSTEFSGTIYRPPEFSPDGSMMVGGDEAGNVVVYNTADWSVAYSNNYGTYYQVGTWSPNGEYLAVPIRDDGMYIYNTDDWSEYGLIAAADLPTGDPYVRGSGWSTDGSIFGVGGESGAFNLYDIETLDHLYSLEDPGSDRAIMLHFFGDDTVAVHGNYDGAYVHEYDASTDSWTHTTTLSDSTSPAEDYGVSADRGLYVSASNGAEAYLYEALPETATISGTVYAPDGATQEGARVEIIDSDADALVATLSTDANGEFSNNVSDDTEYHVTATYDAGGGDLYTSVSEPSVSGDATLSFDLTPYTPPAQDSVDFSTSTVTVETLAGSATASGTADATLTIEAADLVPVSGTAQLDGDPIEGARITGIDTTTGEYLATTTTDASGVWSLEVAEGTSVHAMSEYQDDSGNQYQGYSKPSISAESTLPDGLVGHWPMDDGSGDVTDAIGQNHLTRSGTEWRAGLGTGGTHLHFDGVDDNATGSEAPVSGSQNRTFAAWINPDSIDSHGCLVEWGEAATSSRWTFYVSWRLEGGLRIEVQGDGFTSAMTPQPDTWQLVACILDGDTIGDHTLYFDGKTENVAGTIGVDTAGDAEPLRVGSRITGDARPFHGQVDEAFIADRALTPAELDEYRDKTKGRYDL